ncbi:MAG: hypothetical protein KKA16_13140 [Alphaproteobacteria bacterium]|nr:hypothetical protein [Alphaproteobacteria bacterium]MBU2379111.1 hypothetical protein [Alphaproteobacteria bacterium]
MVPGADPAVDHDQDVGFSSAASLQGRTRGEPGLEAEPQPVVDPAPPVRESVAPPPPQPAVAEPVPSWAVETPQPAPAPAAFGARRREPPVEIEGGMGLYAVYALILFAVPTLGVSALIGIVAVTGRPGPTTDIGASHFIFQQRTLWAGAVAALLGAILIAVGLGVFVLFLLAVWLILRGAAGVLKLKAGRPMPNPRGWLF